MFEEQTPVSVDVDHYQHQINSGANWFFWIAGLSLINSLVAVFDGRWAFAVGLGITQVFDGFALAFIEAGAGPWVKGVSFALDLIVIAIFVGFGFLGRARHTWAFIVGMVIFAIDTLILLAVVDVLGIIIHGVALYYLFNGLSAARTLNAELKSNPAPSPGSLT